MAEMNSDHVQSQIYMKKLLESHKQNEALCTQNETLSAQNSALMQQNEDLSARNSGLQLQNREKEKQIDSLQKDNEQLRDKLTTAEAWGQFQTKQVKARAKAVTAALLLIVVLLIGGTVYSCYKANIYKDECAYERRQRINKESDLEKAQDALFEAEEKLEKVQDALYEAEEKLDTFYSGFAEMSETLFGSSSEKFYAEEAFIVLHPGETKNVKIHTENFNMFTMLIKITESDEEAITAQEITSSRSISDVEITAHSPGYYTVEFAKMTRTITKTDTSFDIVYKTVEAFDLLVIVLEE